MFKYRATDLNVLNKGRNDIKNNTYFKGPQKYDCPESYWKKLRDLEEQYSDINSMVFDLPKIEFDDWGKFWDIWNKEHIHSGRVKNDIASSSIKTSLEEYQKLGPAFRALTIIDYDPDEKYFQKIWDDKFLDLSKEFPKFYQQLYDLLPYNDLHVVRLWQSTRPIGLHRDGTWELNLPSECRISLYDENPVPVFYVVPESRPDEKRSISLPGDSNCFGFNNVRCFHYTVKPGVWEKLLLIPWGQPNLNKLERLIENSIKKYPNYVHRTIDDQYSKFLVN